jgi:phosphoglycolate phosphatase-like HAD superfamily hydrolase
MQIRLITDFDGPIVDVSERYYSVYQFCLKSTQRQGQLINCLSKPEFWKLKRARVPETEIGRLSGLDESQAQAFAQLRRQTVHTMPYFEHDTLVPGAVAALEKLQEAGVDLAVMTMRRVRELDYALSRYELSRFFLPDHRYCLSNDYVKTKDIEDKPPLMERALAELPTTELLWMVGDTEADILAAKTHGVTSIAVLCGIRDRTQLERYEPDFIVEDLCAAADLVLPQLAVSGNS